ncbi:hypothetical protein BMS3Abin06_00318 [bacterium BMS3Abin06]|nr:hypothetical protein BMS3Abin06_00318 [bacterium BMS3Abin06]
MREQINSGKWTEEELDILLKESSGISDPGERIDFLSKQFLKIKYQESTLIGDINTHEVFVINLEGVDCFTFIEYIEAMRRSGSFNEFRENLRKVRYLSGRIAFENRNHFFTDWKAFNPDFVVDITKYISSGKSKEVSKILNKRDDGTLFLPGLSCRLRGLTYIPSIYVDDAVIEKLKTGDYAGIYSETGGLDVSHVGIIIREQNAVKLRHASSVGKYMEVVDEDFKDYQEAKPGIIVLRPRGMQGGS